MRTLSWNVSETTDLPQEEQKPIPQMLADIENNIGLTEAERKELERLRGGIGLTWVDGEKDPMDVAFEHAHAYVYFKTGILLQRKKQSIKVV